MRGETRTRNKSGLNRPPLPWGHAHKTVGVGLEPTIHGLTDRYVTISPPDFMKNNHCSTWDRTKSSESSRTFIRLNTMSLELPPVRKRKGVFWQVNREELIERLDASDSLADVIRSFGLCCHGSNHITLKKRLMHEKIELEHYKMRWAEISKSRLRMLNKGKLNPIAHYLVEGRKATCRSSLKARLIREGLLQNKCYTCGLTKWNGKPITLNLHHENGVSNDNRLKNLSLLCPNCHSQTENFAGKSRRNSKPQKRYGAGIPRIERRKVERPSKEELAELIQKYSWTAVGRQFGVSDNAVRKWAKSYGLLSSS